MKKNKKTGNQPKLRTRVEFNTGTRRHKSARDYCRRKFRLEEGGDLVHADQ
jgi:hypothetical protein